MLTIFSLPLLAVQNEHKYECDLAGEVYNIGEKATIFLEDSTPVLMECKVVLNASFLGNAKYKIAVEKTDWVLYGSNKPMAGIDLPNNTNHVPTISDLKNMMSEIPKLMNSCTNENDTSCNTSDSLIQQIKDKIKTIPEEMKSAQDLFLSLSKGFTESYDTNSSAKEKPETVTPVEPLTIGI
jgi:hypothetical protein